MMELIEMVSAMLPNGDVFESERANRSAFRWGASISALLLLILNQLALRSSLQSSLLALFLVTSIPTAGFQILRGQFGCWVAAIAIVANYCLPNFFPVSRFLLFVVIPDWLAYELRETIAGGVFCLVIAILLVILEIYAMGGCRNCECNLLCCGYWFSMALLFFFTVLYLCLELW